MIGRPTANRTLRPALHGVCTYCVNSRDAAAVSPSRFEQSVGLLARRAITESGGTDVAFACPYLQCGAASLPDWVRDLPLEPSHLSGLGRKPRKRQASWVDFVPGDKSRTIS